MPRLAVIGFPVAHSRSPAMQTAALEAAGLAGEWSYGAVEIDPEHLEARVREMAAGGEYAGVNVTVPHKEAALALAGGASQSARAIGAANTLTFEAGHIEADNTDAFGLLDALPSTPEGAKALVLGAGGAARAAVWILAGVAAQVDIWNRHRLRAERLNREVGGKPIDEPDPSDYELIVNTTSVGLHGEDPFEELPLRADGFTSSQVVVDLVYGERPSALLAAAQQCGAHTVDGIEILVQQGARSFEIWTAHQPDLDVMRAAARGESTE